MEDNIFLLQRAREGNTEIESELVNRNMGLVRSVAVRFLYSGVDFDDLCQIGSIGLVKAIRHFDFSRGVMFSTYAVPVIIGEIRKYLRDDGMVKVSRTVREQYGKVRRAREIFEKENERCPTVGELEALTGLCSEDIVTALDAAGAPVSLDEQYGEDGDSSLGDMIGSDDGSEKMELMALREGIGLLDARDRSLITMRYFLSKTQQEVAAALGMTQVQVSRREKKILQTLRKMLE